MAGTQQQDRTPSLLCMYMGMQCERARASRRVSLYMLYVHDRGGSARRAVLISFFGSFCVFCAVGVAFEGARDRSVSEYLHARNLTCTTYSSAWPNSHLSGESIIPLMLDLKASPLLL